MSGSSIGSTQAINTPVHHHHHHAAGSQATGASKSSAAASSAASSASAIDPAAQTDSTGTSDTNAASGIQKFASELQAILLSAQSGQQSGQPNPTSTADNPATASHPAAATDPTSTNRPGSIAHLADRLQQLLSAATPASSSTTASGTTTTAASTDPNSLQGVLDRLQSTLQTTLSQYGSQAIAGATASLTV
jgi:hypothetical protein